jgi:hypothetical protein
MKKYIFLITGLCCWIQVLNSQYSITVVRPNDIALKSADLWNCIIQNSINQKTPCYIHGTVTELKRGKLLEVRSGDFILNPGITQFNTRNYDALKNQTILHSDKIFEDHILRTNSVPNGNYTLCISLFEQTTQRRLADHCLNFEINRVTPPQLISPYNNAEICEQNPFFIWTVYRGAQNTVSLSYNVHMVEIYDHQKANSAIKTNPCWYCESFIQTPPHQYPFKALPFKDGSRYAWYVGVLDGKKEIARSEVWEFSWKKCEVIADEEDEEKEDETPVVLNPRKKGISYYFVNENPANEIVSIESRTLHFKLSHGGAQTKITCFLYNQSESFIVKQELNVAKGDNYFTIDLKPYSLKTDDVYFLKTLFPDGNVRHLNFKMLSYPR